MRILVTGNEGLVGREVVSALSARGDHVVGYDLANSQDILDPSALVRTAEGCDGIVHCAALLGEPQQAAEQIMQVNFNGTCNVLQAAKSAGIRKIVFLSSVDVLGVFKGERAPDFLPLDESHPCYPSTPYAMSKYLAEEMCRLTVAKDVCSVVCLRPPGVWTHPDTYEWILEMRRQRASFEWRPFWEYGAFIDSRDLAGACTAALMPAVTGFHRLFVSADDITTSGRTSIELCRKIHPDTHWRGGSEFEHEPYLTLLSNRLAKETLNWQPEYRWHSTRYRE